MPGGSEKTESGGILKRIRDEVFDYTQPQLAELLGVKHSTVSRWESGAVRMPADLPQRLLGLTVPRGIRKKYEQWVAELEAALAAERKPRSEEPVAPAPVPALQVTPIEAPKAEPASGPTPAPLAVTAAVSVVPAPPAPSVPPPAPPVPAANGPLPVSPWVPIALASAVTAIIVLVFALTQQSGTMVYVITQTIPDEWTVTEQTDVGERRVEKRYLVPPKPFENQKSGPCDPAAREVEINGGCWVHEVGSAPCGSKSFEHNGQCYKAIRKSDAPPSSVSPWDGGTPFGGDK
ncbi:MAG TPA: helix-turn-helix transcriptional regulator [Myxococcaceae bacterium]|nr:helix-turn-helix transcriptional regulator [Myxococcaceae bacterium]